MDPDENYDYNASDDGLLTEAVDDVQLDELRNEIGLCSFCVGIPEHFFGDLPEGFFSPADRSFLYTHNTGNGIRRAAEEGCPMCWTLARMLHDGWLDEHSKEHRRLNLKRGIIDPEQSIALFMGIDDLSHNTFHTVPSLLTTTLPLQKSNQPVDEVPLMTQWLTDCVQSHIACHTQSKPFTPTRLLALKTYEASGDIVLIEPTHDLPNQTDPIKYTALSHCWGPIPNPMKTTKETYKARSTRISYAELPLTFQHAVTVTRQLEIPYLWIDSLCIVQDDASDWAREVEVMGRVYGGSTCTLAAMSSKNSNGGFPLSRGLIDGFDLPFRNSRVRIFVAEPNTWAGGMHGPLLERAWTFQERNLSIRILHFSEQTLLWECKTARASPELPWMQATRYDADPPPKLMCDSVREAGALATGKPSKTFARRDRWLKIAEQYSARNLTFGKDKLPALSGMAHTFGEENEIRGYAAGLWRDDMPSALLWMVLHNSWDLDKEDDGLSKRPADYRAPSWSWMSLDGSIDYDSLRVGAGSKHNKRASGWNFGQFCLRQIETFPTSKDEMSSISGGVLELSGCLKSAVVSSKSLEVQYKHDRYYTLLGPEGYKVGAFFPDVWSEIEGGQRIYCLSVRHESSDSVIEMPSEIYGRSANEHDDKDAWLVMGLALVEVDGDSGEYVRVGLVRWMKRNYFENVKPSQMVIF